MKKPSCLKSQGHHGFTLPIHSNVLKNLMLQYRSKSTNMLLSVVMHIIYFASNISFDPISYASLIWKGNLSLQLGPKTRHVFSTLEPLTRHWKKRHKSFLTNNLGYNLKKKRKTTTRLHAFTHIFLTAPYLVKWLICSCMFYRCDTYMYRESRS